MTGLNKHIQNQNFFPGRISAGALGLFCLVVIFGLSLSAFTVPESQRALVSQFGKFRVDSKSPEGAAYVYQPGLHFRWPLIEQVHYMDARLRLQDIQSSSFMTQEKKYLLVDLFVKWRIVNFEKFFNASQRGNIARAENLLQQKVLDSVRTVFSRRTVKKVISADRLEIMQELLISIKTYAQALGIDVIDARIKRIEFPDTVKQDVFHRMSTERTAEASKLRAEGVSEANMIRAEAEAQIRIKLATGRKTAQKIRGSGESEAAQIYATGYGQDPNFFELFRSLAAYEKSFSSKKDILVLQPNGEFFKFFKKVD